ncbi:MAG: hypothetical protein WC773_03635 [Patescibacteria group bacterium]|jgi:hypothetical protein
MPDPNFDIVDDEVTPEIPTGEVGAVDADDQKTRYDQAQQAGLKPINRNPTGTPSKGINDDVNPRQSIFNRFLHSPESTAEASSVGKVGKTTEASAKVASQASKAAEQTTRVASQTGKAAGQVGKVAGKAATEATKVVAQGVKLVGQGVARGAMALFANPVSAIIFLVILIIIAIAIAIAVSINGGSSPKQASASSEKTITLMNAGDIISRRQLDAASKQIILDVIKSAQSAATNNPPTGRPKPDQAALDKLTDLSTRLATYSSNDTDVDKKSLIAMMDDINQLNIWGYGGVPASEIGQKIAKLARYYASDPEGIKKYATCDVSDKTACNSFAIRVMHETDADDNLTGVAYDQYLYVKQQTACYEVIKVDFSKSGSDFYSQFAQGDLLYRSGKSPIRYDSHGKKVGGGYGHVGFYIGNGQIAAASIGSHNPTVSKSYSKILDTIARLKVASCKKS